MPTKAILPYAGINVLGSFSLAGFQVTIIGRIWVTAEVKATVTGTFTTCGAMNATVMQGWSISMPEPAALLHRLGILAPLEISDEMQPELDAEEMDALYEERDQLLKEPDEDVD